jgi:signal transduction histidine kinase
VAHESPGDPAIVATGVTPSEQAEDATVMLDQEPMLSVIPVDVDAGDSSQIIVTVGRALAVLAIVGAVLGAVDLGEAVGWSAVGAVVAWSCGGIFITQRRPNAWIGPISLGVPAAIAAVIVCAAVDGTGVGTAVAIATLPTALGALLVLSPDGSPGSIAARRAAWVIAVVGAGGAFGLAIAAPDVPVWVVVLVVGGTVGTGALGAARRCGTASVVERARLQWIGWGLTVSGVAVTAVLGLWAISGWPDPVWPVVVACGAIGAVGLVMSSVQRSLGRIGEVLVHTIVAVGLLAFVAAVYVVVVIGFSGVPDESEQTVLALSILAACVVALTGFPVRRWLHTQAERRVRGGDEPPDSTLETFATRMSRAIPMDELLLQLVESLRATMRLSGAEIWTGSDGRYDLTVSVPHRPAERIELDAQPLSVASRAHVQGNAWLAVWVPRLLDGRGDRVVRFVSVAHLGDLLGFIVVERPASQSILDEEDEHRVLVDIARQLGLALHNVRLDNALQASLDDLQVANEELVASRLRIVSATDESRRRIERNLHDGAQQHLVALAVKVGLIRQLLESDPAVATAMLDELRGDVQATLTELRELAHGIYPPRLRDRGLGDALRAAGERSVLPTTVDAEDLGRYGPDIETALYFCCLEAMQNAGKHAGDGASLEVSVREHDGTVEFTVSDDGVGFDPASMSDSHGFVNMRDRLGAFAGNLDVTSSPGQGTVVRGRIPLP